MKLFLTVLIVSCISGTAMSRMRVVDGVYSRYSLITLIKNDVKLLTEIKKLKREKEALIEIVSILNSKIFTSNNKVNVKYDEMIMSYYQLQIDLMEIKHEMFLWQNRASEILMWVSILVVFSGITFSGLQLWKVLKTEGDLKDHKFEISANRIRITSSFVGVVVLGISLAFLYMFVVNVYTVSEPQELKTNLPQTKR